MIKFDSLTKREIEVIYMLAKGHNNPQIAESLCISRHTVEQHRKNINRKLGIHSYFQLFQYALAFNLI
jgi:DNA-binding CsgD family transcriptional regulator